MRATDCGKLQVIDHAMDGEADLVERIEQSGTALRTPLAGGQMAWRVFGSGAPVLLLHGGHGSWTHWIRNVADLARDHRLLVPDMPGYGDSDRPAALEGPDEIALILADGLDEIMDPAEPLAVAGFSFGAIVAGHLARLHPERVESLVLIGAGGLGSRRPPMAELVNWRAIADPKERVAAHRTNLEILMIHDPRCIDPLAVHLQSENARRTRFRSRTISLTSTLRDCLRATRVPLAGIWGREDATARGHLDERRDLLRAFDSGAEFEIIEGAGHWVQYEAPQAFNSALRGILARTRAR
jgi:2-hydroxy-6-oxonona-2,4-dienedioate hydrolase